MRATYHPTPLLESPALRELLGHPVLLKVEALQPTGSFKDRGMSELCAEHVAAGRSAFYCSSGGNAGLALARAARLHGGTAKVCVPARAPAHMVARILGEGAEVVAHGDDWNAADLHLRDWMASDPAGVYVSPYDDPLLWRGHASLVAELAQRLPAKPAAIVLSVGGGGLLTGIAHGLRSAGWSDVPIVAVETEGAASLAVALRVGRPTWLPAITSLASSLGARSVTQAAVDVAQMQPVHSVTVSDSQAVQACRAFLDTHRLLVEPACGAALAALGTWPLSLTPQAGPVVVIVCGGSNVTLDLLEGWSQALALT